MRNSYRTLILLVVCLLYIPGSSVLGEISFEADIVPTPNPAVVPEGGTIRFELRNVQIEYIGFPDDEYENQPETITWRIISSQTGQVFNQGNGRTAQTTNHACGNYEVVFTAEGETPDDTATLSMAFRVVAVTSLSCGNVSSTTPTPGNIETLVIPAGYNNGSVTLTATPMPSGAWPAGKPAWSGDIASSSGATATVDTTSTGVKTITASCGNNISLRIIVYGRLDLQADSNGDGSITIADDAVEMTSPGVVSISNDGDSDADEIIDSADIQITGQNATAPPLFTELRLNVTDFVSSGEVKIHFQYNAAPATEQQGAYLPNGSFRIWKKQSNEERNPLSAANGGDFVMPDFSGGSSGYAPAQIGMQLSSVPIQGTSYSLRSGTVTLWLESTGDVQDGIICASVEDCGDGALPAAQDELKVSSISLHPSLQEAPFTGGGTIPAARRMTFGLPLVINNDHDGDDSEIPNVALNLDCTDAVVNGNSDLDDMGQLTFPSLPSFLPPTGTVQLSFSGSSLRFFETGSGHACAGTGNINMTASQLYARLKQGNLTYYVESTSPALVTVTMGINHSPPRPVAVIRCIEMTREFVTHDPDFEEEASRCASDNCKQRELMENTAEIALQALPGCYSCEVTARIMETHWINELMGSIGLGDTGSLHLRLQQKFAPATNYEQVWMEVSNSGNNGTFLPLIEDWSYTNMDILVEIYRGSTKLTQLPVKLKTLLKLNSFSPTVTNGEVDPEIVNPYNNALTITYDFPNDSPFFPAQHGYGLRIPYELSETVISGSPKTNGPFFTIKNTGFSVSPVVPVNLLKRMGIIYYYVSDDGGGQTRVEPEQFVKWEGFDSSVGENASKIWEYPHEAKTGSVFASPGKVAKEGKYRVFLGCTDRGNNAQSQTIQFEVEVRYE